MNNKTLMQTVGLKTYSEMREKYNQAISKIESIGATVEDLHGCLFVAGRYIYSPLSDKLRTLGSRTWVDNGMAFMEAHPKANRAIWKG